MNIEVEIFLINQDLEIEMTVEKDRIEIIVIESTSLVVQVLEKGKV